MAVVAVKAKIKKLAVARIPMWPWVPEVSEAW
jgi:hypothetical protein